MNGKPRHPRTEHEAGVLALAHLPHDELMEAAGHSIAYLRQCFDPDIHDKRIHYEATYRIDALFEKHGEPPYFLLAHEWQRGRAREKLTGKKEHLAIDPMHRCFSVLKRTAIVFDQTEDAMEDRIITPNELAEVSEAVTELNRAGDHLLRDLEDHMNGGNVIKLETA